MKLRPVFAGPRALTALLAIALPALLSGCGVVTDYIRDNEYNVPFLGNMDFKSPARLRAGILPLDDQIGLGPADAGEHLARIISEVFADENSELLMVDPAVMAEYARARGLSHPLTPEQAVEACRDLNLNFVMGGAAAHYGQSQVRSGWRKLMRWFTSQQQYVQVLLTLRAYDPSDGTVVTSRSFESRIHAGRAERLGPMGEQTVYRPTQEIIEESLDEAIMGVYTRAMEGIRAFPFKARVVSVSGGRAEIAFGRNVGMPRGARFVKLSHLEDIENDIQVVYSVPGAPSARLTVADVQADTATLAVDEGSVQPGDFIQSWNAD
jgi:hypothetical protein